MFEVERPDAAPVEIQSSTGVIRNMLYVGPSKSQLVSSTSDVPGLLVWDMRSGKMERTLQTDGAVGSMDVSGWLAVRTAGRARGGGGWHGVLVWHMCSMKVERTLPTDSGGEIYLCDVSGFIAACILQDCGDFQCTMMHNASPNLKLAPSSSVACS